MRASVLPLLCCPACGHEELTLAAADTAPDGHVILTTPYHGYLKNLLLAVSGRLDRHWNPLHDGGHVKFFSRPSLNELLRRRGFVPTRFARVGRVPIVAKSMIVEARLQGR